ncbi:MAG: hypothetical protein HDS58_00835 [Barnesiella sp.]|nr:hypothetical protein [Barnesiella sp.]
MDSTKKYDKTAILDFLRQLHPEYIIQYLNNFKILEHADVKCITYYLVERVGLRFHSWDIDNKEDWKDILDLYHHQCEINKITCYDPHIKFVIVELLTKCETFYDRKKVMQYLIAKTSDVEEEQNRRYSAARVLSEAEEVRECNRQFRSLMDDNDAWGNID